MPTIQNLEIISLKQGNDTNHIDLRQIEKGILAYRNAGTTFGGHFHEGISDHKNPEMIYLLQGVIELRTRYINEETVKKTRIESPALIQIPINLWHQLYAYTNVCFIELNSLEEHIADTKYI